MGSKKKGRDTIEIGKRRECVRRGEGVALHILGKKGLDGDSARAGEKKKPGYSFQNLPREKGTTKKRGDWPKCASGEGTPPS